MGTKHRSTQWYQRHVNDGFVKRAQREGKRSRAAFKLTEILDKHGLHIRPDAAVIDLGCAPGSWTAEIASRLGDGGLLVGIDLLPVTPVTGATILQGDFDSAEGQQVIESALQGRPLSLVLSDMAPQLSGNKVVDQARMMHLNDMSLNFAVNHLKEGGHMLLKTFMGEGYDAFRRELTGWFRTVKAIKPQASRKDSSEMFLLAMEFRR